MAKQQAAVEARALEATETRLPVNNTLILILAVGVSPLFRIALAQADVLDMKASYEFLFTHIFSPILDRFHMDAGKKRYLMVFYIHGLIAIVNEWLTGGYEEPIETIATIMQSRIPDADKS